MTQSTSSLSFMNTQNGALAACTTSWDDGYPLDRRVAELLAKYDLTGTFYIPMKSPRQVMTGREIRQLSELFEVGAHTIHHVDLTSASNQEAEVEIRESKKRLEDLTGRFCETFCFPKGRFRRSHLEMLCRAGFGCARTVELLSTRFPIRRAGIYLIPTTVQAAPIARRVLARNCAKRLAWRNVVNVILHTRSRNWTQTAHAMLQDVARRGGVFHLWGHSWEVEEQQQWPQLESVLREMQHLRTRMPCVANSKLSSISAASVPCELQTE